MRYLGGKSKLAKRIVDVMLREAPETRGFCEPFMGGGAVSMELASRRPTLSGDIFPGLAACHQAVRDGFRLPTGMTDIDYAVLKQQAKNGSRTPAVVLAGFGISFGGKWFAGFARGVGRDFVAECNRYCDAFQNKARHLIIATQPRSFIEWRELARPGVTFYCDPPYVGTEGYRETPDWNSEPFWRECVEWHRAGARVFVSEFKAPFRCVAEFPRKVTVGLGASNRSVVDRLFEVQ